MAACSLFRELPQEEDVVEAIRKLAKAFEVKADHARRMLVSMNELTRAKRAGDGNIDDEYDIRTAETKKKHCFVRKENSCIDEDEYDRLWKKTWDRCSEWAETDPREQDAQLKARKERFKGDEQAVQIIKGYMDENAVPGDAEAGSEESSSSGKSEGGLGEEHRSKLTEESTTGEPKRSKTTRKAKREEPSIQQRADESVDEVSAKA